MAKRKYRIEYHPEATARSVIPFTGIEAGTDPSQLVQHAFGLALQRSPNEVESASCRQLLDQRSIAELSRVLVNLNEFAYID